MTTTETVGLGIAMLLLFWPWGEENEVLIDYGTGEGYVPPIEEYGPEDFYSTQVSYD